MVMIVTLTASTLGTYSVSPALNTLQLLVFEPSQPQQDGPHLPAKLLGHQCDTTNGKFRT